MGFLKGLSGADLTNRGYHQALKFGAEFVAPVEVRSMTCEDKLHRLVLDDGQVVRGRTVLIATGATYQRLPVAGCERWDGVCIYYSCTEVHARACRGGRAAVVGGGNSAGQAVMYLADNNPGGAVLLLRGGDIRKSMSDYLARRIERHPKIEVIRHVEIDAINGNGTISGLRLRDVREGSSREIDCAAVFVFIGAQPRTDWLPPSIAVDSKGFILTGADAAKSDRWPLTDREPCSVETTCPGSLRRGRRPQRYDQTRRVCRRRRSPGGRLRTPGARGDLTESNASPQRDRGRVFIRATVKRLASLCLSVLSARQRLRV